MVGSYSPMIQEEIDAKVEEIRARRAEEKRRKHRGAVSRWKEKNPAKKREMDRKWRQRQNPDRYREYRRWWSIKKKYNMSKEEWEGMFEGQGNCCAICGGLEPLGLNWHTDHCHKTKMVRGILCNSCNMLVGNHDRAVLVAAVAYWDKNHGGGGGDPV